MGGRGASSISGKKLKANSKNLSSSNVREIDPKNFANKTLEELENESRGLSKERLYVLDKNGKPIRGYQGEDSEVVQYKSDLDIKDATITHNHPSDTSNMPANFGGTFLITDMKNMAQSKWKEMRVSANGKGEYNYIIRRTKNSDSKGFYDKLTNDEPILLKGMAKVAGNNGDLFTPIRQMYTGLLDNYFKNVAEHYGFEYIKRKKPYKYNR